MYRHNWGVRNDGSIGPSAIGNDHYRDSDDDIKTKLKSIYNVFHFEQLESKHFNQAKECYDYTKKEHISIEQLLNEQLKSII